MWNVAVSFQYNRSSWVMWWESCCISAPPSPWRPASLLLLSITWLTTGRVIMLPLVQFRLWMKNDDNNESNTLKCLKIHKSWSCLKEKKKLPKRSLLECFNRTDAAWEDKQVFNSIPSKKKKDRKLRKVWVGVVVIIKGAVMGYSEFPDRFYFSLSCEEVLQNCISRCVHSIVNTDVWSLSKAS